MSATVGNYTYGTMNCFIYTGCVNRCALIIILWLLSLGKPCLAEDTLRVSVFEDSSAAMPFSLAQASSFSATERRALNFGFSESAFWLKINFEPSTGINDGKILSICYTQLDDLQAFIHERGDWKHIRTGDNQSFASREIKHPCFVFDLTIADQSPMYLRVASGGIVKIPLSLNHKDDFWQHQQTVQIAYGFYFAFLLAMFIYNLFLFLVIRETAYLYYVAYLGCIALFLASMSGHSAMYLWPNNPHWLDRAPVVFAVLTVSAALLFIRNMTQIASYRPTLDGLMKVTPITGLIVLGGLFVSVKLGIILMAIYMLVGFALIAAAIVIAVLNRWRPAYFLLSGLALMIPGGVIYFCRLVGLIDEGWLSNNVLHLTSMVEAMVLSFALAYRIRMLNGEIEQHQAKAIAAQSNLSRSLLKAADYERRALARELHDSFGQGLLVVKNSVSRLASGEQQQQIISQLKGLISDTRNMARNMHPQQIESLGFSTALQTMLTESITPTGIKLTLELTDVTGLLEKDAELHLYRIAQESATNIIKHARAKTASVHLNEADGFVRLMICDDGIGLFSSVGTNSGNGMGMLNMTERAAIINASFETRARRPQGTEIVVQVPIS